MMDGLWVDGRHVEFRELMQQYGGAVIALARPFARNTEEMQDLIQEIWMRVYRKRRQYSGRGSTLAWILATGKSVCVDWQRNEAYRTTAVSEFGAMHPPQQQEPDSLEDMELRKRASTAMLALAGLPDRQREAISSRLLDGLSADETATRMGCKKATVRSLIRNGLTGLRQSLEAAS